MKDIERKETGLFTSTEELRQLILNNPGLPLLVFAGEDSNNGEYGYMACSSVRASQGEAGRVRPLLEALYHPLCRQLRELI